MLSAGLLSTLIFLISLLLQLIVGRMTNFEQLADSATTQVATLEELNNQVIAQMTVGVCRISPDNRLTAVNKAAMLLLELTDFDTPVSLEAVDKTLAQYVANWRSGQHNSAMPFKLHSESKLLMPKLISVGHDFEEADENLFSWKLVNAKYSLFFRTHKPDSVTGEPVDIHSSANLFEASPPPDAEMQHTRNYWTGRPVPYFALHRNGFTLPSLLPRRRWALTPPFHPYFAETKRYLFCGTSRQTSFR